ncbi:MAG: CHAP domain-containing protein, partial [Succinivibrio sp.]
MLIAAVFMSGGSGVGVGGSCDAIAAAAEAEYDWAHEAEQLKKTGNQIADKYINATGVGEHGAWCAAFASYCLQQAGLVDAGIAKCEGFHCAFADDVEADPSTGTVHENDGNYTPQRGDLAIRCSSTDSNCKHFKGHSSGTGEHVEVVVGMTEDNKVETIGGNTWNDTGNGKGNWVGRNVNALGEGWDVFVSFNAGSVMMSGPVAGTTVNIPASHEHRACTGKNGCEKGAVRKTVTKLGKTMTLEFNYENYTSIMTGALTDSAPEYQVYKKWVAGGKKTGLAGLPTINGRYLVAVSPRFGDVGD